jgi:nucleoid DNA-binding protein
LRKAKNQDQRLSKFRRPSEEARIGRNPQTGEEIEISARKVLTFLTGARF